MWPPFLQHPRCLFFIWVIWPAQIPPSYTAHPLHGLCLPFPPRPTSLGKNFEKYPHARFPVLVAHATFVFRMRRNARARASRYLTEVFRHALIDSLNVCVLSYGLGKKRSAVEYSRGEPAHPKVAIVGTVRVSILEKKEKKKGKEREFIICLLRERSKGIRNGKRRAHVNSRGAHSNTSRGIS